MQHSDLQQQIRSFLEKTKIVDSLPDNCKVVVLNHELTLQQMIQCQIVENHAAFSLIYHSTRREFTGIVTLRNILELIVAMVDTLEQIHVEHDDLSIERELIEIFRQRFMQDDQDASKSFITSDESDH